MRSQISSISLALAMGSQRLDLQAMKDVRSVEFESIQIYGNL
jgi:hypothetical protein